MSEHIFTSSFQSGPALQTPKVGCTMVLMLLMPFCLASFQQEQGQANELAETLTRHQLQGVTLCTCYTHVVCIWSNRGSPGVLSTPSCWQPPVMHWISEQAPPWLWLCFWPWAQAQKDLSQQLGNFAGESRSVPPKAIIRSGALRLFCCL